LKIIDIKNELILGLFVLGKGLKERKFPEYWENITDMSWFERSIYTVEFIGNKTYSKQFKIKELGLFRLMRAWCRKGTGWISDASGSSLE